MTWPLEYQRAAQDFERFMLAARDASGLATTNMAWTMTQGVLLTFRRRLSVRDAIAFANVLPPLLRALFLDDWNPDEPPAPFGSREDQTREAQSLRAEHNFSPDHAIEAVATALHQCVDAATLERVLDRLPPEARAFWAVPAPGARPAGGG
ncbi:MAG: DUF2267 domain-containing protein [Nevskiales bacterium]|nr:DUF2267 domain-containing protein [Nevskiales bacterium]